MRADVAKQKNIKYFQNIEKMQSKICVPFPLRCGDGLVFNHFCLTEIHDVLLNKTKFKAYVTGKINPTYMKGNEKKKKSRLQNRKD